MAGDIATNWRELSGQNNWAGLINPSNNYIDSNLLRKYIIHYGERVEATYDALDDERTSSLHGFPRYAPENLFSNVGLEKGRPNMYTVTNYLYAMIDVNSGIDWALKDRPTWIGYVAVATDKGKEVLGRRDILICWRGTVLDQEWTKNLNVGLTQELNILGPRFKPKLHSGFYSIYTASSTTYKFATHSAQDQVRNAVRKQVEKYKDETVSITVTGHSLGGALATLSAVDLVHNSYNKPKFSSTQFLVSAFTFASPQVGDSEFQNAINNSPTLAELHLLRIRTENDAVPKLLPSNKYSHVGQELVIGIKSKYFNTDNLPATKSHNLEIYLHLVAGPKEANEWEIQRDHSLVNKWLDVLEIEYRVPPQWWAPVPNRGMVQENDGTWKLKKYKPEPPTDNEFREIPTTN